MIGSGESTGSDPSKSPTLLVPEVTDTRVRTGKNSSENDSNREVDASDAFCRGAGKAVAHGHHALVASHEKRE